ncbi:sialin-like isoform X2 [Anthonomus grandis grandis]|uniref:sialin-like isoform X2 n=1 Tax=Anthonomus grandis grandis TaxID=2921223 RepID=UPI00216533C1|nr:sialin-like isoform X2 [Anthonomus grandis grandis]
MAVGTVLIPNCVPTRSLIWLMIFTGTLTLYILRTNMSLIILAMVHSEQNSSSSVPECIAKDLNSSIIFNNSIMAEALVSTNDDAVENGYNTFNWDSKLKGLILGAYFWGFVACTIPAAAVAEKYGPRRCIAISFAFSSVLTLLGPLCANYHPYALIASRFFIGLLAGVVYPAIHCLISKWAPPAEKGKFISATLGGSLGTVLTWPLLGSIIKQLGWTWAFYISGILVLLWTILWIVVVYDSPKEHPWIKSEEQDYIVGNLSGTVSNKKRTPPYKLIFFSIPAWALCVAHYGNLWGLFFLMTVGPTFMSTVLGFDLGKTGFLAALPYLARMLAGFVFGSIGDMIVKRDLMSKTNIRKSFTLFSHLIPGFFLIAQTFVGCHASWVITLITLSLAFNGASTITNLSNSQDLAPNFAGSIYGIINCIGSTSGFISPIIVGHLTADNNGLNEWHTIFYIGAAVYIGCGIIFIIFGSAEIQPWNFTEEEQNFETPKVEEGVDNVAFETDQSRV